MKAKIILFSFCNRKNDGVVLGSQRSVLKKLDGRGAAGDGLFADPRLDAVGIRALHITGDRCRGVGSLRMRHHSVTGCGALYAKVISERRNGEKGPCEGSPSQCDVFATEWGSDLVRV